MSCDNNYVAIAGMRGEVSQLREEMAGLRRELAAVREGWRNDWDTELFRDSIANQNLQTIVTSLSRVEAALGWDLISGVSGNLSLLLRGPAQALVVLLTLGTHRFQFFRYLGWFVAFLVDPGMVALCAILCRLYQRHEVPQGFAGWVLRYFFRHIVGGGNIERAQMDQPAAEDQAAGSWGLWRWVSGLRRSTTPEQIDL